MLRNQENVINENKEYMKEIKKTIFKHCPPIGEFF